MATPLLLDLTHTSHTRARTGIQRVALSLWRELGASAVAITHDPHARAWRALEAWEQANLSAAGPATKRGAHWPLAARLRGRLRRWTGAAAGSSLQGQLPALDAAAGLIAPEIFGPSTARAFPELFARVRGPRIALFHDAIALKFPELTPRSTVARFPAYLIELLAFDGIAAISEDSRDSLLDYWRWLGRRDFPTVEAIPLGIDLPAEPGAGAPSAAPAGDAGPIVLSVGSIEARKNHGALLDACEMLWAAGERFTLHLVGFAQRQTGAAALERIAALQRAGRPLRYAGPVSEAALAAAYAACAFTVYPSVYEGFGLPVLESLARGKPCVCSGGSALGESARGGGCVVLRSVGAPELAAAIGGLLRDPAERARLAAEAQRRTFRSWRDYTADLTGWMRTLRRRD
jgi:glycosyltransferase involved in cell wall biosynthesis